MKILNLKAVVLLVFVFVIHTTKAQTSENVQILTDYITNGRLVFYSESSYLSDTMASAITYVDFCPNNRYHYSYDGSYTVKGTENTSKIIGGMELVWHPIRGCGRYWNIWEDIIWKYSIIITNPPITPYKFKT